MFCKACMSWQWYPKVIEVSEAFSILALFMYYILCFIYFINTVFLSMYFELTFIFLLYLINFVPT